MQDSGDTKGSMPEGSHCPPQETGHWRLKKPHLDEAKALKRDLVDFSSNVRY